MMKTVWMPPGQTPPQLVGVGPGVGVGDGVGGGAQPVAVHASQQL